MLNYSPSQDNINHKAPLHVLNQNKVELIINERIRVVKKEQKINTEDCTCEVDYSEYYKVLKYSNPNSKKKSNNRMNYVKRQLHKLIILPLTLPL